MYQVQRLWKQQKHSSLLQMLMFPFEAESCAFVVSKAFGLDTSEYSFPYISSWSSSKDMKELKSSMDTIRMTASKFIDSMEDELKILAQEKEAEKETEKASEASEHDSKEALENAASEDQTPTYEIYQIDPEGPLKDAEFMNHDYMEKTGAVINMSAYICVYKAELQEGETLDSLYEKFNIDHPDDLKGHSLSVSDVVVMKDKDKEKAFFVDSTCFREIEGFNDLQKDKVISIESEAEQLAGKLDQFAYDFDPYGYGDVGNDRVTNIEETKMMLLSGNMKGIKAYLDPIIEDGEPKEFADQAKELLSEMDLLENRINAAREISITEGHQDKSVPENAVADQPRKPEIVFYVAECSEFPELGEFHENLSLQEAVDLFNQIPPDRMHGIPAIGFSLQDENILANQFELFKGGQLQMEDMKELVPDLAANPIVQEAAKELQTIIDEDGIGYGKTAPVKEEKAVINTPEKEPDAKPEVSSEKNEPDKKVPAKKSRTSAKEKGSVLKDLHKKQEEVKSQGKKTPQKAKTQTKKKGDQEL